MAKEIATGVVLGFLSLSLLDCKALAGQPAGRGC